VLVSHPPSPTAASAKMTANTALECQRRAAAAFMVVTMTSPLFETWR
jgi:hypothetical protein